MRYSNNFNNGNGGYRPPSKFLQKFAQFMMGRYGYDQLSKFINIVAIILILLSNLKGLHILYYIGLALFAVALFRIYSKNIYKRQQENIKYLHLTAGIRSKIQERKIRKSYKTGGNYNNPYGGNYNNQYGGNNPYGGNTYNNYGYNGNNGSNVYQGDFSHTYLRCVCCGKELRVPKGIGTVDVTCPSCQAKTRVKS